MHYAYDGNTDAVYAIWVSRLKLYTDRVSDFHRYKTIICVVGFRVILGSSLVKSVHIENQYSERNEQTYKTARRSFKNNQLQIILSKEKFRKWTTKLNFIEITRYENKLNEKLLVFDSVIRSLFNKILWVHFYQNIFFLRF